jgi:two-component system cell cycle sensor histidine kinase/response regulator CckA
MGLADMLQTCVSRDERKRPEGMTNPSTAAETILVVEDEPAVRQLVSAALRRAGYSVVEARDGEHALTLFDQHNAEIDLLLTDLRMPQMDGAELIRRLRARAPKLKVICVSGYPGSGIDLSVTGHYLAKPFSKADLLNKVREVLDGPA